MSHDESAKIEPTLTSIEGAPSIAPSTGEMSADTTKVESAAVEAPKAEAESAASAQQSLPPTPSLSAAADSAPHVEPKHEASAEPITHMLTLRPASPSDTPENPEVAGKPRVTRFALLAACVAIAASFGAVGGSLGVAKFGPTFAAAPPPPAAPVYRENLVEEVKALKDTVAQLRNTTKSLSDNLSALKTSVNSSNNAQNTQIGKVVETLDRVEKAQADQRRAAAAAPAPAAAAHPAPDVTGSTAARAASTEPNAALKQSVVQGWVLRRVYDGAALIESRDGIIEVEPGSIAPGLGRIESIKRQDGRWVVVTARGLVIGR